MPRQSLLEWLDYFARHARGPAFVQPRGLRREVWTYGQVFATACRFGHELDARNIRPGHRLLLWGDDSAEWVAVFLGCMMRGVVVVPLDRVGAAGFVYRIFAEVDAKLLICARGLSAQVTDVPLIILEDVPALVATHDAKPHYAELTREDPLQIIFTSGTTNEPKGVVTTHGNVLANLEPFELEIAKYLRYERWFHPLRFLSLVPLSHVFGQFMGIFLPPLLGAVVVFPERVAPGEIQKTIRKERVSVLVAVPRMVESLQAHVERWTVEQQGEGWLARQFERATTERVWRRWWRFRSVHRLFGWKFWAIVSGGATLEAGAETFWSRIGIAILQGYGMTETTSLISVNHPFRRGAGSIGKVLPGRDLKLSATGEIMVRGESIARNYWQGGKLSPLSGEEGWLRTGDLGELDSEGFLHFKGRGKNVIVTAEGMKVYPQDLENAFRRDARVRDAVVFGYARGGNAEPAAVLVLQAAASAEEVVRSVNQGLAPFQQIRHWYGWPDADFPRTSTQKPRSGAIQARAQEHWSHVAGRTAGGAGKAAGGGVAELIAQVRGRKATADAPPGGDLGLSSLERVELICAV
ncbi:MAG: AMP-binding protein [Terriglobales bacterium]